MIYMYNIYFIFFVRFFRTHQAREIVIAFVKPDIVNSSCFFSSIHPPTHSLTHIHTYIQNLKNGKKTSVYNKVGHAPKFILGLM